MANVILIHGTAGNPDETFHPWLKKELQKKGCKVYAPFFPTPIGQNLDNWMKEFKPYLKYMGKDTVIVGRSLGVPFILRLLEKSKVNCKAAFLVAGFCSDIGLYEVRKLIDTFVDPPFNWKRIQENCGKFFVYNSENDSYVPVENAEELAKNVYSPVIWVKGAGHFVTKKFPLLLKDMNSVLDEKSTRRKSRIGNKFRKKSNY
jgi:predicted alpha/beta hydrolase family esterase